MLKIEQFIERQFGIKLTKYQLEYIAMIASDTRPAGAKQAGRTTDRKAALAYLQDGLKQAPGKYPVELYVKGKLVHAGNATISSSTTKPFTVVFDDELAELKTSRLYGAPYNLKVPPASNESK